MQSSMKSTGIAAVGGGALGYLESTLKGFLPASLQSPTMFGVAEIVLGHLVKKKNEKLGLAIAAIGGYQIGRGFKEGGAATKGVDDSAGLTMPTEVYETRGLTMPGEVFTGAANDAWGNVFGATSPQAPAASGNPIGDAGELVEAGDAYDLSS